MFRQDSSSAPELKLSDFKLRLSSATLFLSSHLCHPPTILLLPLFSPPKVDISCFSRELMNLVLIGWHEETGESDTEGLFLSNLVPVCQSRPAAPSRPQWEDSFCHDVFDQLFGSPPCSGT